MTKFRNRIAEVITITEELGCATSSQILPRLQGSVGRSEAANYCSRAVGMRLLEVDRTQKPMVYRPVQGWRKLLQLTAAQRAEAAIPRFTADETVAIAKRTQPNSVFALGGRP